MVIENDFVPFATGVGANVLSQADYLANADLPVGNQPGVASSALNNKALRQATYMAACLAQFLVNTTGDTVLDDGNSAEVITTMGLAWGRTSPTQQTFTATGSTAGYMFSVSTANATVGATYTNNGHTYTVINTIVGGTALWCSQSAAPQASGTLTKASGTGDATITFSANTAYALYVPTSSKVLYLRIRGVGGGGGGASSSTSGNPSNNGTTGTPTFFGANALIALAGSGATGNNTGQSAGQGGAVTAISSGYLGTAIPGGGGSPPASYTAPSQDMAGGSGGSGAWFGGAGTGGSPPSGGGGLAGANTGGGGGGGAPPSGGGGGGGGGGGAGFDALTTGSVAESYPYIIGLSGTGGGTSGSGSGSASGGDAAEGYLEITEYYQ